MMGNRAKLNGDESDAFSRRSRQILAWGRGAVKRIKRGFAKRTRAARRIALAKEVARSCHG